MSNTVKRALAAFFSGTLFALGLTLSGMTDPNRVLNFLDIAGNWDPTLAAVMAGAVIMYRLGSTLVLERKKPVLDAHFHLPKENRLDRPLLLGAALFGVGWGLVGLCPGPAVTTLFYGGATSAVFLIAMTVGIVLFHKVYKPRFH